MKFVIMKKIRRGGYCMNDNQTDIFGGVTPFQTEEPKQEENPFPVESPVVTPPVSVEPEVINIEEDVVEKPVDSFTEMPFAGVNQQENIESEKKDGSISTSMIETTTEKNVDMEPVEKAVDENSGLKFLLVLGIIFGIVIILLPFL